MPDYRQLELPEGGGPPNLPDPTAVPTLATGTQPPHDGLRALDTLPGSGHRTIFEYGLRGGDSFLVLNGEPADVHPGVRMYPDTDTPRIVGRMIGVPMTPGHFLGIDLVALPSGPTQRDDGSSGYEEDGRGGSVRLEVTYSNGVDTVNSSCELAVVGSEETEAAEPAAAHESLLTSSATAIPWGLDPDADHAEKFSRGNDVTASWVLKIFGSLRPVDLVVVERGVGITVDQASAKWPTAMYAEAGQAYEEIPSDYPIEQLTSTDPGAGTNSIRRALLEHGRQLGPMIAWWGSGTEHAHSLFEWIDYDGGSGDNEAPPVEAEGTAELQVPYLVPADPRFPGWCAAHYARQVDHGDEWLDGRTGVLPVWVALYVRGDAAEYSIKSGDPMGEEWSAIELSTTAGTWEWVLEPGWLEVGTGPEDSPVVRLYGRETTLLPGSLGWLVRYLGVFMRVT